MSGGPEGGVSRERARRLHPECRARGAGASAVNPGRLGVVVCRGLAGAEVGCLGLRKIDFWAVPRVLSVLVRRFQPPGPCTPCLPGAQKWLQGRLERSLLPARSLPPPWNIRQVAWNAVTTLLGSDGV